MRHLPLLAAGFCLAMPVIVTPPAQATAYRRVPQPQALRNLIDVNIAPGRSTAIDFSHVQERIVFVNLADPSRTVFTSNAPIESGLATTLFVTPIQALDFPGLTTSPVTTLQVQTLTPNGDLRLYTFNVRQSEHAAQAGVVITAAPEPTRPVLPVRPAPITLSPQRIAQGLVAAIDQGITPDDDPIVEAVTTILTNVEAGQPLLEAAEAQGVDIEVLEALAALGQAQLQGVQIRFDPI